MTKPQGEGSQEVLGRLLTRARRAGLPVEDDGASLDESGWTCWVVHAVDRNGRPWIVRAARDEPTSRSFALERAVLRVASALDVVVPQWWMLEDGLVAYPRVGGEPAAVEDSRTLEFTWGIQPGDRPHYARQLAREIVHLHSMNPPTGVAVVDPGPARRSAEALLAADETEGLPEHWRGPLEGWLNDASSWDWIPRLLHGDLHPGHTLVSGYRLTGIIDWTDAIVGDPARELVYIAWADEPRHPILGDVVTTYLAAGGHEPATFVRRVAGYADLKVLELLVRGRRGNNDVLVDAALRRLVAQPRLAD